MTNATNAAVFTIEIYFDSKRMAAAALNFGCGMIVPRGLLIADDR